MMPPRATSSTHQRPNIPPRRAPQRCIRTRPHEDPDFPQEGSDEDEDEGRRLQAEMDAIGQEREDDDSRDADLPQQRPSDTRLSDKRRRREEVLPVNPPGIVTSREMSPVDSLAPNPAKVRAHKLAKSPQALANAGRDWFGIVSTQDGCSIPSSTICAADLFANEPHTHTSTIHAAPSSKHTLGHLHHRDNPLHCDVFIELVPLPSRAPHSTRRKLLVLHSAS
ncbi:hypothetical protein BCR39DRAFT_48551 [Naematelia encephala]|uniref:Uncharacterized protein n=1 Tax=Naematelia encephala TaxID=71784 RepID=A0A1Y2AID1_9TREE|nr:hypothetical protein BCR39DRAFT_48551 [Naematelia encephala]